jgi:hypothetical protein
MIQNFNTKEIKILIMTKDLEIKVRRMWKARTKIVPVINGALGTIRKGLDQNLQFLPGDPSAIKLQITLMSTTHIILKVLGSVTVISCCVLDLTEARDLITNTQEYSSSTSSSSSNNNNNSKIYLNTNITSVT